MAATYDLRDEMNPAGLADAGFAGATTPSDELVAGRPAAGPAGAREHVEVASGATGPAVAEPGATRAEPPTSERREARRATPDAPSVPAPRRGDGDRPSALIEGGVPEYALAGAGINSSVTAGEPAALQRGVPFQPGPAAGLDALGFDDSDAPAPTSARGATVLDGGQGARGHGSDAGPGVAEPAAVSGRSRWRPLLVLGTALGLLGVIGLILALLVL